MSEDELREIEERYGKSEKWDLLSDTGKLYVDAYHGERARTDIPALVAEVRRLRGFSRDWIIAPYPTTTNITSSGPRETAAEALALLEERGDMHRELELENQRLQTDNSALRAENERLRAEVERLRGEVACAQQARDIARQEVNEVLVGMACDNNREIDRLKARVLELESYRSAFVDSLGCPECGESDCCCADLFDGWEPLP